MPTSELIIILVFSTLLAEVLIAVLLFSIWRKVKKQQTEHLHLAQATTRELARVLQKAEKLDDQAIDLSSTLIEENQDQLQDIFSKQKHQLSENQQKIIDQLAEQTAQKMTHFQKNLDQISLELQMTLKKIITTQEKQALEASQTALKTVKAEWEQKQNQQLEELTKKTEIKIEEIAKQVLQLSLTPTQHHQFILTQLKKAWEEGLLNS